MKFMKDMKIFSEWFFFMFFMRFMVKCFFQVEKRTFNNLAICYS